jgi:hypoxanthine-guanine phosphoribosyltransferase
MQLGVFNYIPETRLVPTAINDIKNIYERASNKDKVELEEIASILGYKQPKGGALYRRIHSMIAYGLIDGRGVFKITELGKQIASSFHDYERRKQFYKQAVLNVPLWNKLYKEFQKNVPESLQDVLRQMTGAEPSEVKKVADNIKRWYMEDIRLVSDIVDRPLTMSYDIEVIKKLQSIKEQVDEALDMIAEHKQRIQRKSSS